MTKDDDTNPAPEEGVLALEQQLAGLLEEMQRDALELTRITARLEAGRERVHALGQRLRAALQEKERRSG